MFAKRLSHHLVKDTGMDIERMGTGVRYRRQVARQNVEKRRGTDAVETDDEEMTTSSWDAPNHCPTFSGVCKSRAGEGYIVFHPPYICHVFIAHVTLVG